MNTVARVKRPYASQLRSAQAAATRRAVLDAASRLFVENGYVATSMEAVADEARVARATVFAAVGTKKALLKAAYDVALVGDDDPVPFPLRPSSLAVRAEPDPARYLERYAALVTEVNARIAGIYEAVRGAASADAQGREVWDAIGAERRIGSEHVISDVLAKGGRLRDGLTRAGAADVMWVLNDAGLYHALVERRSWRRERFAEWLGGTMVREVLADGARRRTRISASS